MLFAERHIAARTLWIILAILAGRVAGVANASLHRTVSF